MQFMLSTVNFRQKKKRATGDARGPAIEDKLATLGREKREIVHVFWGAIPSGVRSGHYN